MTGGKPPEKGSRLLFSGFNKKEAKTLSFASFYIGMTRLELAASTSLK